MSITKAKDFDGSNVSLTKPTDNKGIRMSWVKNDKRSLMFQVTAPVHYGASDFEGNQKFALTIALDPENDKHSEFIDACKNLKKAVLTQISENAKDFGLKNAKTDMENIESKFYELIKAPKDDSESSLMLMKLNLLKKKDSDEFDITMYDNKNTVLEGVDAKSYLRRGATITAVIAVQSVWVNSKKEAGIKLKLQRARIDVPAPASGKSNPFDDMDSADASEEKPATKAAGGAGTGGSRFAELAEDEEDDVLADVLPAAAPAPAPAAAKAIEHVEEDDDEGEVIQPPPVPKKETKVVKKVVKKTA
jgi:hypothetical protein